MTRWESKMHVMPPYRVDVQNFSHSSIYYRVYRISAKMGNVEIDIQRKSRRVFQSFGDKLR